MNAPIFRLFALFVVLFAVLVGFSSRWAVFGAAAAAREPAQQRACVIEEQRIKRGVIRAADGEVLAGSTRAVRRALRAPLPDRASCSRSRSASTTSSFGRAGLEKYYNDALVGPQGGAGAPHRLARRARTRRSATTCRRRSSRRRSSSPTTLLEGHKGAVVALGVKTGAVQGAGRDPVLRPDRARTKASSTFNTATQGLYPPGSTFKTVTATRRDRHRPLPARLARQRQEREGDLGYAAEQLRQRGLRRHHAHGGAHELGQHGLGRGRRQARPQRRMQEYMDRFGFGKKPPMDYPRRADGRQRPA